MTILTKEKPRGLMQVPIVLGIVFLFLLSACGGSSGGKGTPGSASRTTVSGAVQAPDGQFAKAGPLQILARLVGVEAAAAPSGMLPVPAGTRVELVRINASGTVLATLAVTAVANGRYSFDLTALGLGFSGDLVVRAVGSVSHLRAMVVGRTVNIDPASEAAVRIILNRTALSNDIFTTFTLRELSDIAASMQILEMTGLVTAGADLEATVQAILSAAAGDALISAFIDSADGAGQTAIGPGDVGNYYPMRSGNVWQYSSTIAYSESEPVSFTNVAKITGTKKVNGVNTAIYAESNWSNSGASETYLLGDSTGVWEYGSNDPEDTLTPQVAPIQLLRFPLNENSVEKAMDRAGLDYGSDLDYDGKNEQVALKLTVECAGFEPVTVSGGTFAHSAKIVATETMTVTFSSDGSKAAATQTTTEWYVPGIGLVKSRRDLTSDTYVEAEVTELTGASRFVDLRVKDLIYDPVHKRIYASVPGSAASNPNTITSIDPEAGTIVASVNVGNEPRKLALSDDGHYLYVSLAGSVNQVSRVDLDTMTLDLTFPLGLDPIYNDQRYVSDIEVLPGNPRAVAIATMNYWETTMGIVIYDDNVKRPAEANYPVDAHVIEFAQTSSLLYGYNDSSSNTFYRLSVDASGVTLLDATPNTNYGFYHDMKFAGGLIYFLSPILDPTLSPPAETGAFAVNAGAGYADFLPDVASNRMFYLTESNLSDKIVAYDLDTHRPVGSAEFPDTKSAPQYISTLIRWGRNGLAYWTIDNNGTTGRVVLVRTSLLP
jgi:DNA-binding beta-propeller fold protein YncE